MGQFTGLLGVAVLVGVAAALSSDRRRIRPRIVLVGLGLQFTLAFLLLRYPPVVEVYNHIAAVFTRVLEFSEEGGRFVFGNLVDDTGVWGFVFATKVLPVIVFFASVMAILYHLGIMQRLVGALAWLLRRALGVTGEEALACAANVFVGQTEAPLCIKPFLRGLTRS
ncbi:MAG: Na+ dependent nucleoside transporter N-terminal domain-containing protein, partial [Planctomycetota bacterium]